MPKLSVIVPIYNEAHGLDVLVQRLISAPCPIQREWIFVDDCSTDESLIKLNSVTAPGLIRVIAQPQNRGKGAAIKRAMRYATGDFIMVQDADTEYDPGDIPALLEPLLEDKADVVYGSRFKKSAEQVHRTYYYFANRFLTALSNLASGMYLTDMETCYKIVRSDLLQNMNLRSRRFGIEVEITAYVAKTRARLVERPISYYPRNRAAGKKIGWRDGFAALWHIVWFNYFVTANLAFTPELPSRYGSQGD
jgi:glycosyltransferase involved in cell wall biosynthesis